jgi:hypothetical protein
MFMVADAASPEKIESGIPESELCTFLEHTRDTLVHYLPTTAGFVRVHCQGSISY